FFRKIVRDQGTAVRSLLGEVSAFAAQDDPDGRLKTERAAIAEGLAHVEAMLNAMTGFLIASVEQPEELYKLGQQSVRLLLAFGDLIVAWLLARQAEVAGRALDDRAELSEPDRDFYTGKLAAARFFSTTVLPRLESDRKIIEESTNDLMEIPEGAF
ncbi:MAG: acyl-CoA dehydrogenase C-terminal domain-containing protein, partial [Trebonia sp.]